MEYFDAINEIYDDKELAEKVKADYYHVRKNFIPISKIENQNIGNPLDKTINIKGNYKKYLFAIQDLTNQSIDATKKSISSKIGVKYSAVKSFFSRHKYFLMQYIDYSLGTPVKYFLNQRGNELAELINHFIDYYTSLQLKECANCELNDKGICNVISTNQCPLLTEGGYLPFLF